MPVSARGAAGLQAEGVGEPELSCCRGDRLAGQPGLGTTATRSAPHVGQLTACWAVLTGRPLDLRAIRRVRFESDDTAINSEWFIVKWALF